MRSVRFEQMKRATGRAPARRRFLGIERGAIDQSVVLAEQTQQAKIEWMEWHRA
jgi:hypothetical protein